MKEQSNIINTDRYVKKYSNKPTSFFIFFKFGLGGVREKPKVQSKNKK